MDRLKKFRYAIVAGILAFAFIYSCNMFGCNPKNLKVYECPETYHREGILKEVIPAVSVTGEKALSDYQWKVFEKYNKEQVYFISFTKMQKIEGYFYRSFFVVFKDVPKEIFAGTYISFYFRFICLDNFFYSKGLDVSEKRISMHYAPVIFVNKVDIN